MTTIITRRTDSIDWKSPSLERGRSRWRDLTGRLCVIAGCRETSEYFSRREFRQRIRTMYVFTTRGSCDRILYGVFGRVTIYWDLWPFAQTFYTKNRDTNESKLKGSVLI